MAHLFWGSFIYTSLKFKKKYFTCRSSKFHCQKSADKSITDAAVSVVVLGYLKQLQILSVQLQILSVQLEILSVL